MTAPTDGFHLFRHCEAQTGLLEGRVGRPTESEPNQRPEGNDQTGAFVSVCERIGRDLLLT